MIGLQNVKWDEAPCARRTAAFLVASVVLLVSPACEGPTAPDLGFGEERVFDDHREVDVRYQSRDGTVLAGTLFLPLTDGPYPAVVLQSGAGPWTRPPYTERSGLPAWIRHGVAALGYDKRGVGASGGDCCPWKDPDYFFQLADDVRAGVQTLRERADIDARRIGLFGGSQGGWVVPIVAASDDIAFTMIFSGPAVTMREELLYSFYTGDDRGCQPTGLSEEEIWAGLAAGELDADPFSFLEGPGFDPLPFLDAMDNPGLWLYGGNDTSVPVQRSVANLQRIREQHGRDWTVLVVPDANHALIEGGAMCQETGPVVDLSVTFDWLLPRLNTMIPLTTDEVSR